MKPTTPRFARIRGGLSIAFAFAALLAACQATLPPSALSERGASPVGTAASVAKRNAAAPAIRTVASPGITNAADVAGTETSSNVKMASKASGVVAAPHATAAAPAVQPNVAGSLEGHLTSTIQSAPAAARTNPLRLALLDTSKDSLSLPPVTPVTAVAAATPVTPVAPVTPAAPVAQTSLDSAAKRALLIDRLHVKVSSQARGTPLLIVDGIVLGWLIPPPDGKMKDFDSALVREISVIRGRAAIELYGAAASDGVIIIKTIYGPDND